MDILADTHGFERDFAHQFAVGMFNDVSNKFGARMHIFLNETFLRFMSLKSYLSCPIFTSTGMTRGQGIIRVVVVVATFSDIFLRERERSLANAERKKKRILTF